MKQTPFMCHPGTNRFSQERYDLLTKHKSVFPYEYVDSLEKLEIDQLPEKADFYSHLKSEHISDEAYAEGKHVFETFQCQNLKDYAM